MKTLDRSTPVTMFHINSPIWNGKAERREVGLAANRITKHNVIEFTYVRKSDGMKSIPDLYYFDGDKLADIDYEVMMINGLKIVRIPFSSLDTFERKP